METFLHRLGIVIDQSSRHEQFGDAMAVVLTVSVFNLKEKRPRQYLFLLICTNIFVGFCQGKIHSTQRRGRRKRADLGC